MHPINQVEQAGWVIAKDMYETLLADTHMTVYDINSTASTNLKDSHADNSTSKEDADKDVEREDIYRWNPVKKVIKSHLDPIYTKQFELFNCKKG